MPVRDHAWRSSRRIRVVETFAELLTTPLTEPINAVCWQRELRGDFAEVVRLLAAHRGIATIDEDLLRSLPVTAAGRLAVETLTADLETLRAHGHEPSLDCIGDYPRDLDSPLPTDVYSFHVDSATVPTETILCSYTPPASEGLCNDDAVRLVDVPSVREKLRAHFGEGEDATFANWLGEHHFDLHYAAKDGAEPFSFGIGNLWRIAVQHPGAAVAACIHRAPETRIDAPMRLLLIS